MTYNEGISALKRMLERAEMRREAARKKREIEAAIIDVEALNLAIQAIERISLRHVTR